MSPHNVAQCCIEEVSGTPVTFRYKDYQDRQHIKRMQLSPEEFIRHFLLHILPCGLVRVRHIGLFANGLNQCRALFPAQTLTAPAHEPLLESQAPSTETEPNRCPPCQHGYLVWVELPRPNSHAPPSWFGRLIWDQRVLSRPKSVQSGLASSSPPPWSPPRFPPSHPRFPLVFPDRIVYIEFFTQFEIMSNGKI